MVEGGTSRTGAGKRRTTTATTTTTTGSGGKLSQVYARRGGGGRAAPPLATAAAGGERLRCGCGQQQQQQEQQWPTLKARQLSVQSRRELNSLNLFSVPDFLSPKECRSFITCAEALGFQQQGSLGRKFGEAFRDNGRVSVQSASLASSLWGAGLSALFQDVKIDGKRAVGLNPNIRFYRYAPGQRFGRHVDESADVGNGQRTLYTLLIYLTGGESSCDENSKPSKTQVAGGETVFYDKRHVVAEVVPEAGMALLHIHGARCLQHEAKVVLKGVKYVLRSDVVFD